MRSTSPNSKHVLLPNKIVCGKIPRHERNTFLVLFRFTQQCASQIDFFPPVIRSNSIHVLNAILFSEIKLFFSALLRSHYFLPIDLLGFSLWLNANNVEILRSHACFFSSIVALHNISNKFACVFRHFAPVTMIVVACQKL